MAKQSVDVALPIEFSEVCEVVWQSLAGTNGRSLSGAFSQAIVQGGTFNNGPGRDSLVDFVGYTLVDPPTPCGGGVSFDGNVSYPSVLNVTLGSDIGTSILDYDAYGFPDRFIVIWNGNIVIDTGYRGGDRYDFGGNDRGDFTSTLTGKIDPISGVSYPNNTNYPEDGYPRVTSSSVGASNNEGKGSASFIKTTTTPTIVDVYVYAPMSQTGWELILACPV